MYASDFPAAVAESEQVLARGALDKAHLPLAVAALAAGRTDDAERAYRNMSKVGARGSSIASMGLADLLAYAGRYADAERELERGAAADEIGNQRAPRAMKLVALAEIALASGAPLIAMAMRTARKRGGGKPRYDSFGRLKTTGDRSRDCVRRSAVACKS
jgi:Flp pilus assembly protein TadD